MKDTNLSFEEYKTLVEQAPILIWRSDTTAKCDYFNEKWLAFTGRSMEQEHGDGWTDGIHSDDYEQCLQIYTEAFKRQEIFEMQYRLRRHDNVYRWLFDRGVPFFSPTGKFAGYIGSCIDVTEKVEAQQELQKVQMAEMKELRGLLPICASCKKIRDDQGYWNQIEVYIKKHSEVEFSHSICPDCISKLYPEIYAESRLQK